MTPAPRLRRTLALAVALPVLAFGACGGDDDGASAASGTSASTTTTAAEAGSGGTMGGTAAAPGDAVKIAEFAFAPSALEVKVGTKVTFTNEDSYEHTATADDGSFDSGKLAEGKTFDFTFDEPGTYAYKCSIHNSMTGTVVVK